MKQKMARKFQSRGSTFITVRRDTLTKNTGQDLNTMASVRMMVVCCVHVQVVTGRDARLC